VLIWASLRAFTSDLVGCWDQVTLQAWLWNQVTLVTLQSWLWELLTIQAWLWELLTIQSIAADNPSMVIGSRDAADKLCAEQLYAADDDEGEEEAGAAAWQGVRGRPRKVVEASAMLSRYRRCYRTCVELELTEEWAASETRLE
jgi:hypothetical protein